MLGDDYMANKKVEKKLNKYIKKLPTLTKVIAVLVFLVSLIGTFGVSFVIQKNDKFELKGEKVITMYVGGSYTEPSLNDAIECISFGRNVINTVSINESETTYNKDTNIYNLFKNYHNSIFLFNFFNFYNFSFKRIYFCNNTGISNCYNITIIKSC